MMAVSVAWPLPVSDSDNRDARRSRQVAAVDQPIDKTFSCIHWPYGMGA